MNINISAITDIGLERTNNEDAIIVCPSLEKQNWKESCTNDFVQLCRCGAMMIVADGMGGANAGEIASSMAINTVKDFFLKGKLGAVPITEDAACEFLKEAIEFSGKAIINHVVADSDTMGLGTTIVAAWIFDDNAIIAWCGDSRCYCFNPNSGLKQLTKDHSYVQDLVDKGEITQKQAFNHPDGNIITKCLGDVCVENEPDFISYKIKDGDILLLCSDGLCGYCRNSLIEKTMYKYFRDIRQCQDALLKIALGAGGADNISIILCSVQDNVKCKIGLCGKIKQFISRF